MLKASSRLKGSRSLMRSGSNLKIIKDNQFRSVLNEHKLKLKNWVKIQGQWGYTRYVVRTTMKCVSVVRYGVIFKVDANIGVAKNLGVKHVCPYIREVGEGEQHWRSWVSIMSEVCE